MTEHTQKTLPYSSKCDITSANYFIRLAPDCDDRTHLWLQSSEVGIGFCFLLYNIEGATTLSITALIIMTLRTQCHCKACHS